jgi:hypothetical protein
MQIITQNKFVKIQYSNIMNAVHISWLSKNQLMSETEFKEQLDTIFSTSEVFKTEVMYIDAFRFNYTISDASFAEIRNYVAKCPVKVFGIVMSHFTSGKLNILRLIKRTSFPGARLILFSTSDDGEFWCSLRNETVNLPNP